MSSVAFSLSRRKERLAGRHGSPSFLSQPSEHAFLHVPAKPRNRDCGSPSLNRSLRQQGRESPGRCLRIWDDRGLQGRTVRRRRVDAVEPADRRVEIVESRGPRSAAAISAPIPNGPNASSTISSRPVLATDGRWCRCRAARRVRGSINSTEMPSAAEQFAGLQARGPSARGDDGDVRAFAHDRRLAEGIS